MKKFLCLLAIALLAIHAHARDIVVNAADIRPFCFEESGRQSGIALDILREVAKSTGIDFRFRFLPWKRAQLETQYGADQTIVPLTRSAEREYQYLWVAELFRYNFVLVLADHVALPKNLEEAKALSVGVLLGNPMERALPEMGFQNVQPGATEEMNARKLRLKRIDAWVVADLVAKSAYKNAGGDPAELRFGPTIGQPMRIYLGASRDFPPGDAQSIAASVARLAKAGKIDAILDSYR